MKKRKDKRQKKTQLTILMDKIAKLPAAATGILGMGKSEIITIPGRLLQAYINKGFFMQLTQEFDRLYEKGRIDKRYLGTKQGKACLQELLHALDEPPVDEDKFNIL